MAKQTAIENAAIENPVDFGHPVPEPVKQSRKDKQVQTLQAFKEAAAEIVSWKETTATQKQQLRKIYSDLQIKINQTLFF